MAAQHMGLDVTIANQSTVAHSRERLPVDPARTFGDDICQVC